MQPRYIGRFAPSPSGPLHLGSLVTALGSFLQARIHDGLWHLRIDDIDPPREMPGATEAIMQTLVSHGLQWDGNAILQSQHLAQYQSSLDALIAAQKVFACDCTRQQVKTNGPYYQGTCRTKHITQLPHALRFINQQHCDGFRDQRLGWVEVDQQAACEDFILRRKDGLFAYHLASVSDDIRMGISEIVRGEDLLLPSACQIALFEALGAPVPKFVHLPLVMFADGRKYSKQNYAPPLDNSKAASNLCAALGYLGCEPPEVLKKEECHSVIDWALTKWHKMQG